MGDQKEKPIVVPMGLNCVSVPMEVDTGASGTVLSKSHSIELYCMTPTPVKLRAYTVETISIKMEVSNEVSCEVMQMKIHLLSLQKRMDLISCVETG